MPLSLPSVKLSLPSGSDRWQGVRNAEEDVHRLQVKLPSQLGDASALDISLLRLHNFSPRKVEIVFKVIRGFSNVFCVLFSEYPRRYSLYILAFKPSFILNIILLGFKIASFQIYDIFLDNEIKILLSVIAFDLNNIFSEICKNPEVLTYINFTEFKNLVSAPTKLLGLTEYFVSFILRVFFRTFSYCRTEMKVHNLILNNMTVPALLR